MNLPDPIERALRTFLQAFITVLLVEIVGGGSVVQGLSVWGSYLDAAAIGGLTAVLAYVQNKAEDTEVLPRLGNKKNY